MITPDHTGFRQATTPRLLRYVTELSAESPCTGRNDSGKNDAEQEESHARAI